MNNLCNPPARQFAIAGRGVTSVTAAVMMTIALVSAGGAGETHYLRDIDDLPLMEGLVEQDAGGIVFDKPGGRVVEALASGAVARPALQRFYGETLPALGWQRVAPSRWQRAGERLDLEIVEDGPPLVIRFYLFPQLSWPPARQQAGGAVTDREAR